MGAFTSLPLFDNKHITPPIIVIILENKPHMLTNKFPKIEVRDDKPIKVVAIIIESGIEDRIITPPILILITPIIVPIITTAPAINNGIYITGEEPV